MIVVGLDVATRTGWCRYDGSTYRTGVLNAAPTSKSEPEGVRYVRMAQALPDVLQGADAVVIERTYSRGRRTAEVLNGLTAVALVVCEGLGLEYAFVDATVLKSFATGKGNARKPEMVAAAGAKLGRSGLSDDEADAYWLVRYWQARMRGEAAA